jgi:heptosyltransferase I
MSDISRILVVKLSALGDLFHAMPVVHLLARHSQCKVDWVTQPEYMALVQTHTDVDRVIPFPRKGGMADSKRFLRQLRVREYDLALDLQGLTKSGLVLGLCRAKRKIGSSHPRELAKFFAGETPRARARTPHALDQLLDSCRHLDIPIAPLTYPLNFPESRQLEPGQGPLVALAPRSRWPAKDWPEDKFIALGRRLIQEKYARIVLIGGPDDQEVGERMQEALGDQACNLCGKEPLIGLGGLLKQVDVLVCNDSGPMHFAAAVGTPLVALFGPTDPGKTGPVGEHALVLRPPPGPEGYPDHRSYKHGDNQFIAKLSVEEVFETVLKQLDESPG